MMIVDRKRYRGIQVVYQIDAMGNDSHPPPLSVGWQVEII
jgi:hypothetical protein